LKDQPEVVRERATEIANFEVLEKQLRRLRAV
jgi:hypothetical protein